MHTKKTKIRSQTILDEYFISPANDNESTLPAPPSSLNILQWNARMLTRDKAHELSRLANYCESDIIAVSETGDYHTNIPGYQIRSRTTIGQGVVLFAKRNLKLLLAQDIESRLLEFSPDCLVNVVKVFVHSDAEYPFVYVSHVYIRPNTSKRIRKQFMKLLKKCLEPHPFILLGDLNDRWTGFGESNPNSTSPCMSWFETLTICNDGSITRPESEAILDVTMCSEIIHNSYWSTVNDLSSDHLPIRSEFLFRAARDAPKKIVYTTIKDWSSFVKRIEKAIIERRIHDMESFLRTAQDYLPTSKPSKKNPKTIWNDELQKLKRKRNRLRKQRRFRECTVVTNKMRRLFKSLYRKHQLKQLLEVANSRSNPFKTLFKVVPALRKKPPPPRIIPSSAEAQVKSTRIAEEFAHISNDSSIECPQAERFVCEFLLDTRNTSSPDVSCSEREIISAIMRTQSKSAPGPDRLSGQVFKQLIKSEVVLKFLHKEIESVLHSGHLPELSRDRLVIPVPKSSGGFRPISLLSVFSKIIDRILSDRLKVLVPIRDCQFGCRKGHSSQHALARVLHHAGVAAASKKQFALLCLDFSKAYDRVNPFVLLQKLIVNNVPAYIIRYVLNWMKNRSFRVMYHGETSDTFSTMNGLPQGSPLSVFLWLVFINDIDVDGTSCNIFMDDTAVWSSGDSLEECLRSLTKQARRIERWCTKNKVRLNIDKSGWIANTMESDFGNRLLLSNHQVIPERRTLRYLGAIFKSSPTTSVLLFDHSILVGTLRRYNGLLKRVRNHLSESHLLLFATALIQGKLNYFLPLLGMEADSLIEPLNVAWRETQRVISGGLRSTYVPLLHHRTGLPPLRQIIEEQAGRLWLQIMSTSQHILRTELDAWDGYGDGWSPLGSVWRAQRYLSPSIHGGLEHLEMPHSRSLDMLYTCKFLLPASKKAALELHRSRALVHYDCHYHLWTDGSYLEGRQGGAAWLLTDTTVEVLENSKGLLNAERSYQTELFAITSGLWAVEGHISRYKILPPNDSSNCIQVLSDCRAVLQKLQSLPVYPKRLSSLWISLLDAVVRIQKLGFQLWFTWIPGHRGIGRNDYVDRLANDARMNDPSPITLGTSLDKCKALLRHRRDEDFASWLVDNNRPSGWKYAPPRDFANAPRTNRDMSRHDGRHRYIQVQLFRIQTGHTRLNAHRHRIDPKIAPDCRLCGSHLETALHLFLECEELAEPLSDLRRHHDVHRLPRKMQYEHFHAMLRTDTCLPQLRDAVSTVNSRGVYF